MRWTRLQRTLQSPTKKRGTDWRLVAMRDIYTSKAGPAAGCFQVLVCLARSIERVPWGGAARGEGPRKQQSNSSCETTTVRAFMFFNPFSLQSSFYPQRI